MKLQSVVPWGRSFSEYTEIFSLSEEDLQKQTLGAADGPASFNAELTRKGGRVVSADPIYQFTREQIQLRIDEVYPDVMAQLEKDYNDYVWESNSSPSTLGQTRMAAMKAFLKDFDSGKTAGRYMNASLPTLPFSAQEFDLALCSHYLFLYTDHISLEQHIQSLKELCRVAKEVRVYPLITLNGMKSKHLNPVMAALTDCKIKVNLSQVGYHFQKGANEMLTAKTV